MYIRSNNKQRSTAWKVKQLEAKLKFYIRIYEHTTTYRNIYEGYEHYCPMFKHIISSQHNRYQI